MKIPDKVPEPGLYYHYKHDSKGPINNYAYEFVGTGCHTEDDCRPEDANLAVYRPLYESASVFQAGKLLDVRPLEMFLGEVIVADERMPRFRRITDPSVIAELEAIRDRMYGESPR